MDRHTPLPWFAVNDGTAKEPMWSVKAVRIAGQKPRHEVAICATGDSPQEMETANAAYIVKCVNAHDELVAALKRISMGDIVKAGDPESVSDWNEMYHRLQMVAAVALAETES